MEKTTKIKNESSLLITQTVIYWFLSLFYFYFSTLQFEFDKMKATSKMKGSKEKKNAINYERKKDLIS